MALAQTEVYEVATFYHHFDVVKEGETPPPALTVRVCDSIACELNNSSDLLKKLPGILGKDVRVLHAPCVGRCEVAPCVVVGQNPVGNATVEAVHKAVAAKAVTCEKTSYIDLAAYKKQGGYKLLADCLAGKHTREDITKIVEDSGLAAWAARAFPTGRKWKIVAAEPAPRLMAVNIDEGEPGTFKDRWYLERDPHRFLEGMLVAAWAVGIAEIYIYLRDEYAGLSSHPRKRTCFAHSQSALCLASDSIEARRGGVHLRRRVGHDRVDRGQARHAAPAPAVRRAGGPFRPPTLEHNMESVYWVREIVEKGAAWFSGQGRNGRKGLRSFSVSGRVKSRESTCTRGYYRSAS
jgi:formate dehydrogenase